MNDIGKSRRQSDAAVLSSGSKGRAEMPHGGQEIKFNSKSRMLKIFGTDLEIPRRPLYRIKDRTGKGLKSSKDDKNSNYFKMYKN
jgi:hypothetical protein